MSLLHIKVAPHGLSAIDFFQVFFEPGEHARVLAGEMYNKVRYLEYVQDAGHLSGDTRLYANALCSATTEEELQAAKQWLVDMTRLRCGA